MAWKGEDGDKRNTKYALAGAGGAALGSASLNLSPTQRRIRRISNLRGARAATEASFAQPLPENRRMRTGTGQSRIASTRNIVGAGMKAQWATPGYKRGLLLRGGLAGAGAAVGAGLYGASRKKRDVGKSDSVSKIGVNPATVLARRAARAAAGDAPKRGFLQRMQGIGISGAREAGRGFRYARNNAMPLVVGGSIGAGGATAYQQTRSRRSEVGKSAKDAYLVARYGKSYVSVPSSAGKTLQMLANRSNAIRAMEGSADPKVAAKGRLLSRRMTEGMKRRAKRGWSDPRANLSKSMPSAVRAAQRSIRTAPWPKSAPGVMRNPAVKARLEANTQGRVGALKRRQGRNAEADSAIMQGRIARAGTMRTFPRGG